MYRLKAGFLIIEILVSLALITGFIVMCMRFQAQSLAIQAQAIDTMATVDQLEMMCDAFKGYNKSPNISNCKFSISSAVEPVTNPSVQGNPPNFSMASAQHMKVMTVTLSWTGQSGSQLCCLPVVFKEIIHGGS